MPNTLTGLFPTLYNAMDTVSREMVGFIPAVSRDASAERAAVNQTVRSPIVPAMAAKNIAPKNIADAGDDQSIEFVDIVINKQRFVDFNSTGEEELGLGSSNQVIMQGRFAQAMRTLVNEMEADIFVAAKNGASRAVGTAGTAPFGTASNLTDFANVRRILEENGAPQTDLQLVVGSAAMANLRGVQAGLFRVNEAGRDDMLRNGLTDRIQGFALRQSMSVGVHTAGTGTSYVVNTAGGEAIGQTVITTDGGSGTILAGDTVTFAGHTARYVVNTALAGGSFAIGAPGLRVAVADDGEITRGNAYTPNMAFDRSAIVLATRTPALPAGGDQAEDRTYVTDPVSGLTFEVAVYRQMRQVTYFVGICWGVRAVKSAHIATLMG